MTITVISVNEKVESLLRNEQTNKRTKYMNTAGKE
jgi:hypothetical protein